MPRHTTRLVARTAALLALLGALLLGQPAKATVMVEVPMAQMVTKSVAIVRARVVASDVQLVIHEGGADPFTVTTLEVDEWLRGNGPERIHLRERGGETQAGGMWIDGTPAYAVGEEVLVFLEQDPIAPERFYRTLHMVQGKFTVRYGVPGVETVVIRDTSSVAFASWGHWQMNVQHGGQETMPLSEFRRLISEGGAR